MKPEAQRIAIAEACGWRKVSGIDAAIDGSAIRDKRFDGFKRKVVRWNQTRIFRGWSMTPGFHQLNIDESNAISTDELLRDYEVATAWKCPKGLYHRNCPNYPADLNALHEAEKMLNQSGTWQYAANLGRVVGQNPMKDIREHGEWMIAHATAAQRAEAFLKVVNRWRDDE